MANVTSGNSVSSSAQLGNDVVTLPAMADDSVDKSNIKTGAVGTDEILDGEIVNADINASAAIADTKLATISTAGKVSGSALTSLSSIPAGAGAIPLANLPTIGKFGGTGADGALSITSGTTTLDLGGARYYIKNYTSISITGTGALAFSNPHARGTIIILKSQGNVTLTSSTNPLIDTRGMGAAAQTEGTGMILRSTQGTNSATGGLQWAPIQTYIESIYQKAVYVCAGSGGGNGDGGDAGGRGGGGLLIECGLAFNGTGTINTSGSNGSNGTGVDNAGGGGGACGLCVVLYSSLTANSMTVTATGGAGGNGGTVSTGVGIQGGSGAGGPGGAGGAGGTGNPGAPGNAGGLGAGGGGKGVGSSGGTGGSSFGGLFALNTEFA